MATTRGAVRGATTSPSDYRSPTDTAQLKGRTSRPRRKSRSKRRPKRQQCDQTARLMSSRMVRAATTNNSAPSMVVAAAESRE